MPVGQLGEALTPAIKKAPISPAATEADVAAHTEVFAAAADGLLA